METTEVTKAELISQKQLQEVIVEGGEILQSSELRVSKAISVGENILQAIKEEGMTPELDERANKFLVNCRTAKTDIENKRKPITAMFDMVRKQFTEIEGKLDVKKVDAVPALIQKHRDDYVKKIKEEEAARQRAAQAVLDKKNEAIEIKASLETQLSEYVQNHIAERKTKLQNSFNNITLENFAEKSKSLRTLVISYDRAHFDSFSPNYNRKHHTQEETTVILIEFMDSKDFTLISAVVVDELKKFKAELIEKLPSLKTSLDEMAKASEEEAKQLAAAKAQREKEAAIAQTTINTIEGATRAYRDYIAPYSFVVAGLVAAQGAMQIAKIAGVQAFEKGTLFAPYTGKAVVDEAGPELHFDKNFNLKSEGKKGGARVTDIVQGDKIIPADVSAVIRKYMLASYGVKESKSTTIDYAEMGKYFDKSATRIVSAINNKKDASLNVIIQKDLRLRATFKGKQT